MRTLFLALALAVLLLPAAACNDSVSVLGPPAGDSVVLFDSGSDALSAASVSPVEIRGVSVRGSLIFMELGYPGGCADHRFALHGSRAFLESLPPQAVLVLSHDDGGESCSTPQTLSLVFDLGELERVYREGYRDDGPLQLRLFGPGSIEPFRPLPLFEF